MRVRLPKDVRAPLLARAFVRGEVCERHSTEVRDRVELLASELVTNAVVHAGSLVELDVDCEAAGGVRVEVSDGSAVWPEVREAALMDESGRGMALVDRLSTEWGVREGGLRRADAATPAPATGLPGPLAALLPRQDRGKVVWFRVAADAGPVGVDGLAVPA